MCSNESDRQQFHYSARNGWLNDPNGLFWKDGVYHLFHQYNPGSAHWGEMHWNSAVSTDLVHWEEQGVVLAPDESGTMFSGGAAADPENRSGLGSAENPPILLFYTAATRGPSTQNVAFSTDGGRTFRKYAGNPVIGPIADDCERDPSVAWDPDASCWRMALYLGDRSRFFGLFESHDLLHWKETGRFEIPGGRECPELFQIRDETTGELLWAVIEANGNYRTGSIRNGRFDFRSGGQIFRRAGEKGLYAGQSFKNAPDGRRIFLAWQQDFIRNERFSQSMSLPVDLRCRSGKLLAFPVPELLALRGEEETGGYEFEFRSDDRCRKASFAGTGLCFDGAGRELRIDEAKVPLPPAPLSWRVFLDRNTIELFDSQGRIWIGAPIRRRTGGNPVEGDLPELVIHHLASIWR